MQNKIDRLIELIEEYKATDSVDTLDAIADLVDSEYEVLEPIMASHGVTY